MEANEEGAAPKAPTLEEMTRNWREIARYGINRYGLGSDDYSRVTAKVEDQTGLTYDEAIHACDDLNKEAHMAAGSPSTNWGVTKYFPKLETPVPERWAPDKSTSISK